MRSLVTFSSPVIYRGGAEPTVGIYGIEGSKPGAAAASIYLSHKVIRLNKPLPRYLVGSRKDPSDPPRHSFDRGAPATFRGDPTDRAASSPR
jgi:hypothetical protein